MDRESDGEPGVCELSNLLRAHLSDSLHADADANTDPDPDPDADANTDADANANTDADTNTDADAVADTDADADANANANADTNADTSANAYVSRGRLRPHLGFRWAPQNLAGSGWRSDGCILAQIGWCLRQPGESLHGVLVRRRSGLRP